MENQSSVRLSFLGWEIKYRITSGELCEYTFTSFQVGHESVEDAFKAIFTTYPIEMISSRHVWIEPVMQFSEDVAESLKSEFPSLIAEKSYRDYLSGEKEQIGVALQSTEPSLNSDR